MEERLDLQLKTEALTEETYSLEKQELYQDVTVKEPPEDQLKKKRSID